MMVAEVYDIFAAAKATRKIEQGAGRIGPTRIFIDQAVLAEQLLVLLLRECTDVAQLLRIANDNDSARTEK